MNAGKLGNKGTGKHSLVLVKKAVACAAVQDVAVVREGSTGRVVVMQPVLPRIWAVADAAAPVEAVAAAPMEAPKVEVAFYRKYTEAMLRRYSRFSSAVFLNSPVG